MEFKLTLPIAPSVNQYLGYKVIYVGRKPVPQPFETKTAKEYKSYVKKIIQRELKNQQWVTPAKDQYVIMDLIFYFDRKRKDSDNAIKVMQDAIVQGCLVEDDDIIMPRVNNIFIDKRNPRVEVVLSIASKIGVFNDTGHLNEFKSFNCNNCKKSTYKRNCGIFQKALENRIEPEINIKENICYKRIM